MEFVNKFLLGDCQEVLKELPDNSVELHFRLNCLNGSLSFLQNLMNLSLIHLWDPALRH